MFYKTDYFALFSVTTKHENNQDGSQDIREELMLLPLTDGIPDSETEKAQDHINQFLAKNDRSACHVLYESDKNLLINLAKNPSNTIIFHESHFELISLSEEAKLFFNNLDFTDESNFNPSMSM